MCAPCVSRAFRLFTRPRTSARQLDELKALHEAIARTANTWELCEDHLKEAGWQEAAVRLDHAGATRVVVQA